MIGVCINMDKEEMKKKVEKIVNDYLNLDEKKTESQMKDISEADVRADFIDRLFEALGWDINNPDEYNREKYLRGSGFVDITIQVEEKPMIFIEAKRFRSIPFVKREEKDWIEQERQVLNYAASPTRRIKWAILTNFEKLRLFNALNGLLILDFETIYDYKNRFKDLLFLSKEYVASGKIEKLSERKERPDIDLRFLELMKGWRLSLANDIYQNNKENDILCENGEFSLDRLKSAIQRLLDRLIIVRYAEDKLILDSPDQLKAIYDSWKATQAYTCLVKSLTLFFEGFDKIHNSKIFEKGHLCEKVTITDDVLGDIINDLYEINFRKFDFDILGNTYETYLGTTIHMQKDGTLGLKPAMASRKEHGIYYTPPYIVDYIVKNTVGELLKGKEPDEVNKIKVVDPACGSGSFLIKAYDYFHQYYEEKNKEIKEKQTEAIKNFAKGNSGTAPFSAFTSDEIKNFEQKILKENIYGVDLDKQAAEIASVNLMLKAIRHKEKLPLILGENIKVGNSLIYGTKEKLEEFFGENWIKKTPLNWSKEFKGADNQGGFDIVIGNPPYISAPSMVKYFPIERNFLSASNEFEKLFMKWDIYVAFFERGLKKLKNKGYLAFILPYSILSQNYAEKLRYYILENCCIKTIVNLSKCDIFKDATVMTCILVVQKEKDENIRNNNLIQVIKENNKKITEIGKLKSEEFKIPQKIFYNTPNNMYRLELNAVTIPIINKIENNRINFGDICYGSKGVVAHSEVENKSKESYIHTSIINNKCKPYIEGKEVERYSITPKGRYLEYDYNTVSRPSLPELLENEKIIVRIVAGDRGLIATYDNNHYYTDHSFILFTLKSNLLKVSSRKIHFSKDEIKESRNYDLKFITGLINSKLLNFYYKIMFSSDLNVYPDNVKALPIYKANPETQKEIALLVNKIINFNYQLSNSNLNFERYLNIYPRVKDDVLKNYVDKLSTSEKEVLKDGTGKSASQIEAEKIVEFDIDEEGETLIFTFGYLKKTTKGTLITVSHEVFQCKITDNSLRKFLYYSIKNNTTPGKLGKGNLINRLYKKVKIPRFEENPEMNKKIIDKIMNDYLPEVEKYNELKEKIEETDNEIDRLVYELYGLTEAEIKIVEDSLQEVSN